jgi:two-component sensor histidine kinase
VFIDCASPTWDEDDRLAALRRYSILDTPPEPDFDDIVRLAAQVCRCPIALISLIDDRRQWFKAELGLGIRETPLVASICARAILQPRLFMVRDTTEDPRFQSNSLVVGAPHLRFYAGAPLKTPEGLPLGTLCVLDTKPRDLTPEQQFSLATLARSVETQLELRRAVSERDESLPTNRSIAQRQTLLVRELHHRIRNTLALVQSLLGSTARSSRSIDEFYAAFSARIASLAKTQTLLTENYWQTACLREMLEQELRPVIKGRHDRAVLHGGPVDLSADLAVPLGMALHELTSNAARHGALSVPEGGVEVAWRVRRVNGARKLHLRWAERGGPTIQEPKHRGFGSTLLERVLPMQTNADVQITYKPQGLTFRMEAPLIEHRLVPEY